MNKRALTALASLGLLLGAAGAGAVPAISDTDGWGGHVNIGAGVASSETNMVASLSSLDLGDDRISSLNESPGSEDLVMPVAQFEARYTLAENGTQFYLGNQSVDYVNFELSASLATHLGIRQEIPEVGLVQFSLHSTLIPLDVWKDPYLVDAKRSETERTATGVQVAWDQIFDTGFEFTWAWKDIELDDEDSGESLPLSDADKRLLRREGDFNRWDISYDWQINERHRLVPGIGFVDRDLDGDAMAEDGPVVSLRHLWDLDRWRLVTRLLYMDLESDEVNPIYGEERDMESLGASVTAFYSKPFGWERWTANVTASYFDEDSNIDFYDASFGVVSFAMFYRFD
ncbi:MAG: DUF2860 domain-containing protein [Haliea sp.]|jgi:hypothetical protein|nr:DUF2860 domain-containing protein [Haliea sp.]